MLDFSRAKCDIKCNHARHASGLIAMRTPAGFFHSFGAGQFRVSLTVARFKRMTKKPKFKKPALTPDKHRELFSERGLSIPDAEHAEHYIRHIGYYRLSGYTRTFQEDGNKDGKHKFVEDACFNKLLQLYIFDRKLRLLVMDAIERIEVSLRACISDIMSIEYSPHWYTDKSNFRPKFRYDAFMDQVHEKIEHNPKNGKCKSRVVFIKHYYDQYGSPDMPPSWMVFELLSFGSVSKIFSGLKRADQKKISDLFGLSPEILSSWMHSLSYLRNLCAHHQRLWNRFFTISPTAPKAYQDHFDHPERLYPQLFVIQYLMRRITTDSQWARKLNGLITGYSVYAPGVMRSFPSWWRADPIWRLAKKRKDEPALSSASKQK